MCYHGDPAGENGAVTQKFRLHGRRARRTCTVTLLPPGFLPWRGGGGSDDISDDAARHCDSTPAKDAHILTKERKWQHKRLSFQMKGFSIQIRVASAFMHAYECFSGFYCDKKPSTIAVHTSYQDFCNQSSLQAVIHAAAEVISPFNTQLWKEKPACRTAPSPLCSTISRKREC